MKKRVVPLILTLCILILTAILTLCILTLTACSMVKAEEMDTSKPPEGGSPQTKEDASSLQLDPDETPAYVTCRIIDGAEDGALLLAALDDVLYGGHETNALHDGTSVYRMTVGENTLVYLDGKEATAADLQDGMPVEIAFNGTVAETFPAQLEEICSISAYSIGTRQNPSGTCYDLCGLYLQVLDDLWQKDSGLNQDISVAGLDLSQAPGGLLDSEKAALAWRFGELHGVEVVTGTHDELVEQGYITVVPDDPECDCIPGAYWNDGCLFSIISHQGEEQESYSLPVVRFDVNKWCGPLAAYYFYDCYAVWPEMGTWSSYTVGEEMIS